MGVDLDSQRVLITGAARGIGLAVARRFHELGATVCGWDIDPSPIEDNEMFECALQADVSDENSVGTALEASLKRLGHVDVLVANAGVNGPTKPAWDYSLDEWQCGDLLSALAERRYVVLLDLDQIDMSDIEDICHTHPGLSLVMNKIGRGAI